MRNILSITLLLMIAVILTCFEIIWQPAQGRAVISAFGYTLKADGEHLSFTTTVYADMRECIMMSNDGASTDTDVCDCLRFYGLEDTTLCK